MQVFTGYVHIEHGYVDTLQKIKMLPWSFGIASYIYYKSGHLLNYVLGEVILGGRGCICF